MIVNPFNFIFMINEINVFIDNDMGYTPTPVISHAILSYNRDKSEGIADGVIITPSHNPPEDGGLKYNSSNGGPANTNLTKIIEDRANEIMRNALQDVKRIPLERALKNSAVHRYNYINPYVADLQSVVDMSLISSAGLKIGADELQNHFTVRAFTAFYL